MNPFKLFTRVAITCAIILFAIQPYNWFCKISSKCESLEISRLLPTFEGDEPVNVVFEITNYREGLKLVPEIDMITTVKGRINEVTYHVKNTSNKLIKFRTVFEANPKKIIPHIKRHQCLCYQRYKLKKGEELTLKASFTLTQEAITMIKKQDDNKPLVIRYKVK